MAKEDLPNPGELSPGEKQIIDANFETHLLDADVGNSLMPALTFARVGMPENINPLETYEEYLRAKAAESKNPDAYYGYVMGKSDPAVVQEYNAMVRVFNEELEETKRKKDSQRLQEAIKKMLEFLRTERKR
ncbi:MAG: hypothetical protein UY23_C0002G0053 [Candidatus Jorgensenbacteria bacterium GW2011_GWA1_48_11]|uniref:Uncharacterized protein n=1 Tax=Candidatus Jorgensenbacteria bacterium GW2011_GWA1_48_11 TaxID=1618660 RepID=A0A0G1UB16_9BACT|nr:MAG: hypothetical protein UY23_C0002G0053 [Candidatus Jorgensenbacteria bacterium GW2011_GWA1_48_11]KKW12752.1 MAG: hypothetical protein UY51_C0001G0052 [Candidatus Jorgensenbacteria bacterium GW2011_GWB1_49_9]